MRGYALARLGQKDEAVLALQAGLQGASRSPHALAIRCMAYIVIGDTAEADRALTLSLRRICSGDYRVPPVMEQTLDLVLGKYQAGGAGDLMQIISDGGKAVRSKLLLGTDDLPPIKAIADVVELLEQALVEFPDSLEWLREHAQEGALLNARWMGAISLAAHVRMKADPTRIQRILSYIHENSLPLPASLHLDAMVELGHADMVSPVELYEITKTSADGLSHASLSRVLQLAVKQSWREVGNLAWDTIEWRFTPLPHDRYRAAKIALGDDLDVLKGRIERTIGSLDHAEALDVLLSKHILMNDIASVQATFNHLVALRPSREIYNRMLAFYAAHARADEAVELFDSMLNRGLQPTLGSLTSLLSLFANRRDVENAQNVFDMMPSMGFVPDAAAWTAMLNAEVEVGEWDGAARRWQSMPEEHKSAKNVLSVVLKAYVQLAAPTARILELFDRIDQPTGYMWSCVLQSAVDDKDFDLAEKLFEKMRSTNKVDSKRPAPGVFHYSILLYGYMQDNQQARAKEVYNTMLERGIIPTSVTYGMMLSSWRHADGVTAFAQASRFAASVFIHAKQRPEAPKARGETMENIYGPLISLSGNIGDMDTAEGYLKLASIPAHSQAGTEMSSMTADDVEAQLASDRPAQALSMYTRLLDAYRRAGQTDSVMAIWDQIFALACRVSKETASEHLPGVGVRRSQDNVLCIPLSIVLDSLAAAGRLFDIRRIWERVSNAGFGFDAQNYNHYAVALARTGDIEKAFAVVEDILIPRYKEVIRRQSQAYRDANTADRRRVLPVDPANMTRIGVEEGNAHSPRDIATQPAMRPPNRRSEQRWAGGSAYMNHPANATGNEAVPPKVDVQLLRAWRPSDSLWRPSTMTLSVLEHVWKQLQDAKSRSWFVLADAGGEAEDGEEVEQGHTVTLPNFGDVPVRDAKGEVSKSTPAAILMRLNKRYVRTVAMIMFHKRKRHAAKMRERRR